MIDTHTHLYSSAYGEGYEEAIERSVASGVTHLILPGIDLQSIDSIRECHNNFPRNVSMAMGLHPTDIGEDWEKVLEVMGKELLTGDYVAVGEIGLDLYWEKENLPLQREVFRRQLKRADEMGLPAILHSRDAFDETIEVISEIEPKVPVIFHSFTGSSEDVLKIRKVCDPYFGINGVVTYKNAQYLRDALPIIGIERLILETDSPYLTPVPHRGKKNESSYLCHIRDKISEVLASSPEEIETITDANAKKIFGI